MIPDQNTHDTLVAELNYGLVLYWMISNKGNDCMYFLQQKLKNGAIENTVLVYEYLRPLRDHVFE